MKKQRMMIARYTTDGVLIGIDKRTMTFEKRSLLNYILVDDKNAQVVINIIKKYDRLQLEMGIGVSEISNILSDKKDEMDQLDPEVRVPIICTILAMNGEDGEYIDESGKWVNTDGEIRYTNVTYENVEAVIKSLELADSVDLEVSPNEAVKALTQHYIKPS